MSNEYDNDQVIHPDSQQPSGEQGANTSGYYHYTGDTVQDSQTAAQPAAAQPTAAPQDHVAAQNSVPYQQDQPYGNGIPYQQPQNTTGYQASNDQTQYPNYGGGAVPPTNPMSGYNVGGSEPPKKKGGVSGKVVVAAALVCALIGGAVGGGAALLAHRSGNSEDNAVLEASESEEESSANDNSVIRSKTIDVTTNSTSTKMTPQDVYENYVNAVVLVYNQGTTSTYWGQAESQSSGSGMIISKDGYVLTNNHVVEGTEKLTVMTTSGEEYDATVIGADEVNDVALLKIEGDEDFPTVSIGDSDQIEVGEQVCAIGNPLGELTNTLTVGYVSALDREISERSTGTTINMFQTDCAINSGNSGGPIFDMNGNVVGITTAKYSSSGYSNAASVEGIGFCIPINDAMSIVNDLMQYGYVKGRVSMGVSVRAMDTTVAQYYNLPTGVYVAGVTSGSAAENAGIQEGDMICAIDGDETASVAALKQKLKDYKPGDTATVSIYRSSTGKKLDVTITFDEMQATTTTDKSQQDETQQEQQNQSQQQGQTINPFDFFGNGN
ncbi:MAG: trypsin-like peptidase domain-containing protein [Oscillospiraceae bacterium]|nr:trypsin-like peptidase domain-containing protein [Oscillospiraceae bacterium]